MKEAIQIINEIRYLTEKWEPLLSAMTGSEISVPRNGQNRNIKQIMGHLIDSTSNNIHRIVHLQYQESPLTFPNYASEGNNDRWIAIQNYEGANWDNMIQLWKHSLLHYCHVVGNINDEKLDNEWIAGPGNNITLRAMVEDFPRHLKLHLGEIRELADGSFYH